MAFEQLGSGDLAPEGISEKRERIMGLVEIILDDATDQTTRNTLHKEMMALVDELPEDEQRAVVKEIADALPPMTLGFEPER